MLEIKLELTLLKDLVLSTSIYFDKSDLKTEIKEDEPFMDIYNIFKKLKKMKKMMQWVLRLEINRKELMNKNITMDDIHHAIYQILIRYWILF